MSFHVLLNSYRANHINKRLHIQIIIRYEINKALYRLHINALKRFWPKTISLRGSRTRIFDEPCRRSVHSVTPSTKIIDTKCSSSLSHFFLKHTGITCWKPIINKPYLPILEIYQLNLSKFVFCLYYFMLLHETIPYYVWYHTL